MAAHVLFPHAMYFDIEDARHPRPASPGSAEALAAGPAAKEVGEEKSEDGVVDTCGGREKRPPREAPGYGLYRGKRAGECVILSVGLLIFGRFPARGSRGPFGPPEGPAANGRGGKRGRPGN